MLRCCGVFKGKFERLSPKNGYYDRSLEFGFCPHCNKPIITYIFKNSNAEIITVRYVKRKALKLYNELISDIIPLQNIVNIKYGNKSNMGFHWGENKEIKNSKGKIIKIKVAKVDFNGTKNILDIIQIPQDR